MIEVSKRRMLGIYATALDGKLVPAWIADESLACLAGVISISAPITVVVRSGEVGDADYLVDQLARRGYLKVKVVREAKDKEAKKP